MSRIHVIPKEALPTVLEGSRAPLWWAMIVLVTIETTVFATLLSGYFYLRFRAAEWPPIGIAEPDLLLPIINTGVLLSSSVAVLWASRGIRSGDVRRLKIGMGIGLVLEVVFFVIKVILTISLESNWTDTAYGSIFTTINQLHTGHVLVAIFMVSVAEILAIRGYFTRERRLGVQIVNIYWQFVAIIWIPIFVVLFLVPRWF